MAVIAIATRQLRSVPFEIKMISKTPANLSRIFEVVTDIDPADLKNPDKKVSLEIWVSSDNLNFDLIIGAGWQGGERDAKGQPIGNLRFGVNHPEFLNFLSGKFIKFQMTMASPITAGFNLELE
jgi:hypothetical protein